MVRHVWLMAAALPLGLAACGGSETPNGSTSSSSSSSASSTSGTGGSMSTSTGTGGAGGAGGGSGGAGGGSGSTGSTGSGGSMANPIDPTYIVDLTLPAASPPPGMADATMYKDVAYGLDPAQKFDIILPKSATKTPLMIHIHGGGFVGGDKAITNNAQLQQTLAAGVAYASLNYRLLNDVDTEGVIKPLTDSKRALQFIRYHADELNIDATRVVVKGGSAGAGTSLWIGLHDEMAGNGDAVDKMSTRVLGIAANATQSTYELMKWETVVFVEYGIKLMDMVTVLGSEQRLNSFYGMASIGQFDTPEIKAYRAEVDMFAHMSADDPPIFVHNPLPGTGAPTNEGQLFHHGNHAKAVKAQGTAAGIPVTAVVEAFGIDESNGQDEWTFLLDKLKP